MSFKFSSYETHIDSALITQNSFLKYCGECLLCATSGE